MKFTESHEWIELEKSDVGVIGVTQYAQQELGDIVYVELPLVGRQINSGQEAAVLESTKAAADIYSPVTGTIVAVNEALTKHPELIKQSPEKEGWIFKVLLSNPAELDLLMDQTAYQAMLKGA